MRTLLKGGLVVSGTETRRADILIEGETILAVGTDLPEEGARVVDCGGKLMFPDFIVGHTPFVLPVAGTPYGGGFFRPTQGGDPPPWFGSLAGKGGGEVRLRLRLPYDHRRLERRDLPGNR